MLNLPDFPVVLKAPIDTPLKPASAPTDGFSDSRRVKSDPIEFGESACPKRQG
jgi:hypothetical protein